MNRIKLLKKEIADKIAAGEVIEQPLSVVKELVENSLDAGATQIVVEIAAGGKDYIRVTDNGSGIEKDDMRLAFLPHATSKIETEEDLARIESLGFRGEALASVAAVSRLEILSKPADVKAGTRLTLEASEVTSEESAAAETGTTIIVRDLFYNLPARRKFLKSDSSEAALITEFMSKIALAYPNVRIRLINNGTILFSTPGKGDVYQTILTVYSPQNARKLLPLSFSRDGFSVKGYVSSPLESKTNRKHQVFFVNGRLIKSALLDRAVSAAYSDKLFEGRFPSVYMFLDVSPASVDVNIHPRKAEIKFFREQVVFDFVVQAIRRALLNPQSGNITKEDVKAAVLPEKKTQKQPDVRVEAPKKKVDVIPLQSTNEYKQDLFKNLRKQEEKKAVSEEISKEIRKEAAKEIPKETPKELPSVLPKETRKEVQAEVPKESRKELPAEVPKEVLVQEQFFEYKAPAKQLVFSELHPISQLFVTYILAEKDQELYIIDQHAAHERIMFEHFLQSFNEAQKEGAQLLLTPIVLELDRSQMLTFRECNHILQNMGFALEEFGDTSLVVKEIPLFLSDSEAEDFLNEFFEAADEQKGKIQARRDAIISRSCKAAVKAHDKLSYQEMLGLFTELDKCENPFSCPHGRPTFIKFSEYELERMFRRK